jgi:lipopolysaccharide biosynthesis glycosyltransferase
MTEIMLEQIINYIKNYNGSIDKLCEETIKECIDGDSFEIPIERFNAINTQVYFSGKESYVILSHIHFCLIDLIINNKETTAINLKERYIELIKKYKDNKDINQQNILENYGDNLLHVLEWSYNYCNKPIYIIMFDNFVKDMNIIIDTQKLFQEDINE